MMVRQVVLREKPRSQFRSSKNLQNKLQVASVTRDMKIPPLATATTTRSPAHSLREAVSELDTLIPGVLRVQGFLSFSGWGAAPLSMALWAL